MNKKEVSFFFHAVCIRLIVSGLGLMRLHG